VAGGAAAVLAGEADLAAQAQAAGFEVIAPSGMPFAAQARAFAQASHVIAAGGPALANLVFCRPGTTVCELRTEGQQGWRWRHLAALADLRYGCVVVQSGPFAGDPHGRFAALLADRRFRDG
jgi:capsular polysaccharide biosynthesis protein